MENEEVTILQRRKRTVKFTEEEILLILRAYLAHPSKWSEIIDDVNANTDRLDHGTRELYRSASNKQLRDRMSTKLSSLLSKRQENIESEPVRNALNNIRNMERQLVQARQQRQPLEQQPAAAPVAPNLQPRPPQDMRDEIAATLSSESDQEQQPARQRRRPHKRPLADLVRENHTLYNKLMKKKIPNILRELGISSDDHTTDSD